MTEQTEIEVWETLSDMGGHLTVEIMEEVDAESVVARIWHGKPTANGWEPWKEWHGITFPVSRIHLKNRRMMSLYSDKGFSLDHR